ncbi:MAG: 3-oxoacyl-ACP reductase FabG [Candidatus Marinimicrobia bacterium]|nr:3-oxoacyl-ACP reductase FabG [Candidatus Neomarinimicrobiota bacterium]
MFRLDNYIAIVTGASRGIGQGIVENLAEAGAHVVCVSRSFEAVKSVASELKSKGFKASFAACDIADFKAAADLVQSIVKDLGKIDILVNNAGITRDTLLMRMSEEDWDTVINTNLKGAFNTTKAVTRPMMRQRHGRIINISSVVGLTGNAGQTNYAASKAGLIGFTKATARELASRGITVNCIAPGFIETDMTAGLKPEIKEAMIAQIPLRRIGNSKDIATMVQFLASDAAGYITGQTYAVDGGMTM